MYVSMPLENMSVVSYRDAIHAINSRLAFDIILLNLMETLFENYQFVSILLYVVL